MTAPPSIRRSDKLMMQPRMDELLANGYSGNLATVGPDGAPYLCPLLYVWKDGLIWLHNSRAMGHLQSNIRHEPRVCFAIDRPGKVFAYGRFQCDTSVEYQSVLLFGRVAIVDDHAAKTRFFDALMAKYFREETVRPKGYYPRLADVTLYSMAIERMTGKETFLPPPAEQWPALDKTRSPDATAHE
jgi:uncharacterized protein